MIHDPVCPDVRWCEHNSGLPCAVIKSARADEQRGIADLTQAAYEGGYRKGVEDERKRSAMLIADAYAKGMVAVSDGAYARGVEDAAQAVEELDPMRMFGGAYWDARQDAVAAIRALSKEKK